MAKKRKGIPEELRGTATLEDVNAISEKLEKCYSQERYSDFQKEVETITDRAIRGESRKSVKEVAIEAAKEFYTDNAWKQKTFWIPTLISIGLFILAIIALFR